MFPITENLNLISSSIIQLKTAHSYAAFNGQIKFTFKNKKSAKNQQTSVTIFLQKKKLSRLVLEGSDATHSGHVL